MTMIAYSTASMNALSRAATAEEAVAIACRDHGIDDTFLVVVEISGEGPKHLHEFDRLPATARVVWRGANELAQRFRRT